MANSLIGKNAVVTGGSRGIGAAIAIELARRGASVMITYVSSAKAAESIAGEINSQGSDVSGYAIQADSSKAMEAALRIVAECRKRFPEGIDIIVNNAADGSDVNLTDLAVDNFDRIFHTNVLFPMLLLQQARSQLRKKARIVNISSTSARRSFPSAITYAASKAALESITRSLAKELGRELDCTVNAVNPGPVNTDMWNNTEGPELDAVTQRITMETAAGSRIGETNDIAPIVAFLCEEQSRWVTGSTVCANGGLVMV
ncbi:hypothetical protein BDV27DRAFT_169224 [Aspergillus caelatus]|uniref:Ketoreductase domain-containing protein n=2 Tax=Aspergillus subgen. Circumdati TaxID=2720871 RepID=A0A5N6ZPG3_9EURO|nr:uncharacterized protein BDV27DRAFT_169224 [Aspergillus caelatus]KAE8358729.1 hypothetical protein BDV27DRAFT_169224 [Aspergillus caelatus]KAE8414377.1 hypothetical protein BDV36DRAFT_286258 [Aspergillus pseudocaelatus]